METKDFGTITVHLDEQHAVLAAKADSLRAELAIVEDHLARIEAAKAALSGAASPSAAARLTKKERKKAAAPSATKAQVINFMVKELSQSNVVQESKLKSRIEQVLIESGHSRMGYSLRFKEALSDSRFQKGLNGISLKNATSPSQMNGHATMTADHERINA